MIQACFFLHLELCLFLLFLSEKDEQKGTDKQHIRIEQLRHDFKCVDGFAQTGCGSDGGQGGNNGDTNDRILQIDGLTYEKSVTFDYARCLAIDQYEGGYSLVDVFDDAKFLDEARILLESQNVPPWASC